MGHPLAADCINAELCGLLVDMGTRVAFESAKEKNINCRAAGRCMRLLEEMAGVWSEAAADGRARAFDQGEQHDDNNGGGGPADDVQEEDGVDAVSGIPAPLV